MSYERDKRYKRISSIYIYIYIRLLTYIELVPKVICKNRRFSICRDLVVTEKSVSTVMSIVIMIVILYI